MFRAIVAYNYVIEPDEGYTDKKIQEMLEQGQAWIEDGWVWGSKDGRPEIIADVLGEAFDEGEWSFEPMTEMEQEEYRDDESEFTAALEELDAPAKAL